MSVKVMYRQDGLESVLAKISKTMRVQVGVLSNKDTRDGGGSNVVVGLTQEFGSVKNNIPARSFLRMPLESHKKDIKAFLEEEAGYIMKGERDAETAMKRVGIFAEGLISDAFETGGFGKWQALDPKTVERKGSSKPLIDTGALTQSITSRVV